MLVCGVCSSSAAANHIAPKSPSGFCPEGLRFKSSLHLQAYQGVAAFVAALLFLTFCAVSSKRKTDLCGISL